MTILPDWLKNGYLRLIDPIAGWLIRLDVNPNTITTIGTFCTIGAGSLYATGHIRAAGWFFGLTALFDVLEGVVARRTNRSTVFGAFYDSTLDRVSDAAILGGLAVFFAIDPVHASVPMLLTTLVGLVGTYLTSYTRARAEALGIDARVGMVQRPERVVLLSAPQAFFGLALGGLVLTSIIIFLTVTAWITVYQRIRAVHAATRPRRVEREVVVEPSAEEPRVRSTALETSPPARP